LLEDQPRAFAQFVAEEPARPLFLRPSLVYHFTRLWHETRDAFWINFHAIVQQDQVHLRQIVRLVLPAVVISEARESDDLQPLITELSKYKETAKQGFSFLLQALRILETSHFRLWSDVLRSASSCISREFAWDVGVVADRLYEKAAAKDKTVSQNCGTIGRSLLSWAWDQRRRDPQPWIDRLIAIIAVPLVAKTYSTDLKGSRALLGEVLAVTEEPNFPIDCIYRLTDEVDRIIPHDPEFTSQIYEQVFGYEETSEEKTNMGTPVLGLISNRRQDYDGCQFQLIQAFPRFVSTAPLVAARTAMRTLNTFVFRRHVLPHLKAGQTLESLTQTFDFRGKNARYVADMSAIWDESHYPDQPLQIASNLFRHIEQIAEQADAEPIGRLLDVFAGEAQAAFLWKRLLFAGAEKPAALTQPLWPLCLAPPIFLGSDSVVALGAFIEQAIPFLSKQQLKDLEKCILKIPRTPDSRYPVDYLERRRDRLLARVPSECLVTDKAKEIRRQLEFARALPANEPLYKISSTWRDYTEDEFLRDRGVEIERPANKALRTLYEPLQAFETKWRNKAAPAEEVIALLPSAKDVFAALHKDTDAERQVIDAAWQHVSEYARVLSRQLTREDSETFWFVRTVLVEAVEYPSEDRHTEANVKWESATWSPSPVHAAAQTLPRLTHFAIDAAIVQLIKKLSTDPVPSVRFLLASELWRLNENAAELAWELLSNLAAHETNALVLDALTVSIWNLIPRSREKSLSIIQVLYKRIADFSMKADFVDDVVAMITDLAIWDEEQWAISMLKTWRETPIPSAPFVDLSGRRMISYIKPEQERLTFERARKLLLETIASVEQACSALKRLPPSEWNDANRATLYQLYEVIDQAVLRLYFAADIDPSFRERNEHPLTDDQRRQFFNGILPVLLRIVAFANDEKAGFLFAPTAHHFIQLINGVLKYDPKTALRLAADVVRASKPFNYNFDSLAMKEIVRLIESILADHRAEIQDEDSIRHLLNLLDSFVEAGWPDALQLVWRLDEIYR